MNRHEEPLQQVNLALQRLLGAPEPAPLFPAHRGDRLMVWFLLGGKDVGKSTFLDALLGTPRAGDPHESVEGTQHFIAYIHETAIPELQRRLQGLSVQVQFLPHTSPRHQYLCLIDSPDFDSRFERHVHQVHQILSSGATDGAVLLSSPEKYKNRPYWEAFQDLSHTLSPRHILFVLTKADELGGYLEEARADFARTVAKRMALHPAGHPPAEEHAGENEVYLINSLERGGDFQALEHRLLRPMTAGEVRSAQHDNLRHARRIGSDQIREHYRLEEVRALWEAASAPDRLDDICDDAFPEPFFHAVATRLCDNPHVAARVREKVWSCQGRSLAGLPALHAAAARVGAWNPFRTRPPHDGPAAPDLLAAMGDVTRWGEEPLEQRLAQAQRQALSRLLPDTDRAVETLLAPPPALSRDLTQSLEDLLAQPVRPGLRRATRWLLNLPVHLYTIFFVFLLLSPLFLLLKAWGVRGMPAFTGVLDLDNVKVAVIGFSGYYLMAALHVVRKQRELAGAERAALSHRFVLDMKTRLRGLVEHPLRRFRETLERLEEDLRRAEASDRWQPVEKEYPGRPVKTCRMQGARSPEEGGVLQKYVG